MNTNKLDSIKKDNDISFDGKIRNNDAQNNKTSDDTENSINLDYEEEYREYKRKKRRLDG